ncbi:MAG TPA: ABC transporter substrate-binding protein [Anaerolineaceae bacterium]|nr:ABC transporter substrate-binding protein [Anaerolineaceae bacterium]
MRKLFVVLSLVIVTSLLLAACGTPTEAPVVTEPPVVEVPTEAPTEEPTEAPTEAPTPEPTEEPVVRTERKGGWLDEIIYTVADPAAVLTQIQAGDVDIYAEGLAPAFAQEVRDSGLKYSTSQGTYYGILFNPATFNDGRFNPFSNRKIREAFNWLTDRNYFAQEIFNGGGKAKFFAITTEWPDYADLADTVRKLESYYAYDLEKAREVITTEMEAMGAELVDGAWTYEGEPVKITFIIRNDAARTAMGDWTCDRLEELGFTTIDRQYKSGSEASPIWIGSDPKEGLWHLYTAGWGASVIDRDQGNIFQEMYLPTSQQGIPVWYENIADPEFQELGDRLYNADYNTVEERKEMMARALELSLQDSFHMWWIDSSEFTPYVTDLVAVADLAAGVQGAQVAPYSLRYEGVEGGSVKWAQQDLFAEPYNPIAGTNWTFDQAVVRATQSGDVLYDPYTGLVHGLRLESSAITVLEGLPVGKTLDWVTLDFAPEIVVPDDAWIDWDAEAQKFITVAEAGLSGTTAKRKAVSVYPADLFETVKWHDGSNISLADMMMSWILTFDRAKEESAIYDAAAVPTFTVFQDGFKGLKIVSTDPLTIEYYSDVYSQDAELNAAGLWPTWTTGELSFSQAAAANAAEAAGLLAYSPDKSTELEVEWTSFIGGPSLEILAAQLDELIANQTIPYEATLGQYITAEEAVARYEALKAWYTEKGHFWQGTGAYYLDQVFLTEKSAVVRQNADYVDLADRWDMFANPMIATAEIDGPGQVKLGEAATFEVFVTFQDEAYPADSIKIVKYLLYNAANELVVIGEAELVEDGYYVVELTADDITALGAGASKLEIAVVPIPVSQPTFTSVEFVVAQ